MRHNAKLTNPEVPIEGVAERILASIGSTANIAQDPENLIVVSSGNRSHPIEIQDIGEQLSVAPVEFRGRLRKIIRQDWPLTRRESSDVKLAAYSVVENETNPPGEPVIIAEAADELVTTPQVYAKNGGVERVVLSRSAARPEVKSIASEETVPKLKLSHKLGILAVATSTKIKTLEIGKKAKEYKDSWVLTADEVTMDIAKRIDNINIPQSFSDVGRRTSLLLANTVSSAGNKLEKHASRRNILGFAAAAVALASIYSVHKYGIPLTGGANAAEKTNHANDLLSVAQPTKTPQAEHIQLGQSALGPKANTEHAARVAELVSNHETITHTETINSATDTIWNNVDKQLQSELGHKPTNQQVIDGCNKVFKLNKHIGGWEGAKHLHTGFSYRIPSKLI